MNQNTSNRSNSLFKATLFLIVGASLLALCGVLWKTHSETQDRVNQLADQNSQLREALESARTEIRNMQSGDSSEAAREKLATTRQSRPPEPAEAEIETLLLQTPTVEQTPTGLQARLAFLPDEGYDLPKELTLVVRVPGTSTAKILSFAPESEPDGIQIAQILNATGKLAYLQCTPADLASLVFLLDVSEPITATVRGSEGVIDFALDIRPDGCTVRKL